MQVFTAEKVLDVDKFCPRFIIVVDQTFVAVPRGNSKTFLHIAMSCVLEFVKDFTEREGVGAVVGEGRSEVGLYASRWWLAD